jgi:ABC-type sugar transport system permease subunit
MKIKKGWAVVAALLLVASIAVWVMVAQTASSSDLLKPSAVKTGLQNFSLGYDSQKGILLVGTYKNVLIAYDKSAKEIWRFEGKGPFHELKVDSKARKVYAGCEDNNVYILDLDSGSKQLSIDVERRIYSVDATSDGKTIAVSAGVNASKHNLMIYDDTGKQLANVKIGSTSMKTAFSSDQKSIYIGTNRAEMQQYDLTGKLLNKVKLSYEIIGFQVLPQVKEIVVGTRDSSYTVLDENLKTIRTGKATGDGLSIGASSDGNYVGLGSKEGFFTVLDKNGKSIYYKKVDYSVTGILFTGHTAYVTGLGDFLYELNEDKLHTIAFLNSIDDLLTVLSFVLPVLFLAAMIMTVESLKKRAAKFFKTIHKHRTAYLMLVPTVALLMVFCYYPTVVALIRAFTDWSRSQSSMADIKFIGFQNFKTMIDEGYFFIGLKNLLIIILTSFAKVLTVPLLVAKLVYSMRSDRSKYWFRFLFVVPMVVPGVVGALMWAQIYDPTIGLVNQVLHAIGMDNWQRVWLGDPSTAIWAIVFMGFPFIDAFAFLVYYGGLISIPSSLFEAAKVDGSNPMWDFTRIQLPLIVPQFKLLIVLTFIGSIQNFTNILLLTSGGPGSATYVPGLELYYNATKFGRYGYACALGVVMFVAILAGTIINMKIKAEDAME